MSDTTLTTAFAPGSVTTIFALSANPQDASFDVNFTIEDGVDAAIESSSNTAVSLDGEPTHSSPLKVLPATRRLHRSVADRGDSVGYGFAACSATILATNDGFDLGRIHEDPLEAYRRRSEPTPTFIPTQ